MLWDAVEKSHVRTDKLNVKIKQKIDDDIVYTINLLIFLLNTPLLARMTADFLTLYLDLD